MPKQSAGILMYRRTSEHLEVLLVHPGGPFWAKKDLGAWSIPKGEFDNEDAVTVAKREFQEETGVVIKGGLAPLAPQKLKGGKLVYAWAVEGDLDTGSITSNTFEIEWPPNSGKKQVFPEVDRAEWFSVDNALTKVNPGQTGFIKEIAQLARSFWIY